MHFSPVALLNIPGAINYHDILKYCFAAFQIAILFPM